LRQEEVIVKTIYSQNLRGSNWRQHCQHYICCMRSSPVLLEEFSLEHNTHALEKWDDVSLTDLQMTFRWHVSVLNMETISSSETLITAELHRTSNRQNCSIFYEVSKVVPMLN
jgi:hypothetical protein